MTAKMRKPRRLVKVNARAQYEALHRLNSFLDANNPKLVRLLVSLWDNQQSAITYKELRESILRGYLTAEQLDAWRQDYAVFFNRHLRPILTDAVYAGGKDLMAARKLGADVYAPMLGGIENWIDTHGGEWIEHVTSETRNAVSTMIQYAADGNTTVDDLARLIRPTVGLTTQQSLATLHYYEGLCDSLKKDLLDKYPDMKETTAEIRAAAMAKESTIRYASRRHRERAVTIAETELAFAYNKGADEAVKNAVAQGLLPRMIPRWSTAADERVCEICGALDGAEIELGGEFDFPGRTLYAGQKQTPPAHPRCRCALCYEVAEDVPEAPARGSGQPVPETRGSATQMDLPGAHYRDATAEWYAESNGGSGVVQDMMAYTAPDGTAYKVDGHNVVLDYTKHEKEIAELLARDGKGLVEMVPKVKYPQGVSSADYRFRGKLYDLKTIYGNGKNTVDTALSHKQKQANRFVLDFSYSRMTEDEIDRQIGRIFASKNRKFVKEVIEVKNGRIVKVIRRIAEVEKKRRANYIRPLP